MDVVLQTATQPLAHRIAAFFNDNGLKTFPKEEGHGDHAIELGPADEKQGPCLVLITNVQVALEDYVRWFQSSLLARRVVRLYWLDPTIGCVQNAAELALVFVNTMVTKADDGYLANCLPTSLGQLNATQEGTCEAERIGAVRIQCTPRKLEIEIAEALPADFPLDPKVYTHVLAAVEANGKIRYTLTCANTHYRQPSDNKRAFADLCSTAVQKLEEALLVLDVKLENVQAAIDVGAAPGAWTTYLAKKARRVLAIDPAALSPSALLPNVFHIRLKGEEALSAVQDNLAGCAADLLVCDMNQHPYRAAEAVEGLIPAVRPGGLILITLKFPGVGRDRQPQVAKVTSKLAKLVEGCQCLWLMANTVNERTFIAWRSASPL
eukprot:evm.model.scf_107.10 EVM.evm.TU.scf_107.10   scf_107:135093-147079(-)